MKPTPQRINMFVYNNCTTDARVMKEAATLSKQGFLVRVIAVMDKNVSDEHEFCDGFEIFRLRRDSIHIKVVDSVQRMFKLFETLLLIPFRMVGKLSVWSYRVLRYMFSLFGIMSVEGLKSENTNRRQLLRILRNPHRYSIYDYFRYTTFGRTVSGRLIGYCFSILLFPLYTLGWLSFALFEAFRKRVFLVIKRALVPYHRTSVFNDYYIKAADFCLVNEADILHFHDLNTLPVLNYLRNKDRYLKIYDSHELYTEIHTLNRQQKKKYVRMEKKLIHNVDQVITVNQSIADELVSRYGIEQPDIVMNCPPRVLDLPDKSTVLADAAGLKHSDKIILYQGGYSTGRGLEELILAMKNVHNAKLVMMGWGRLEYDLKMLSEVHHIEGKIVFIPPVEQGELLYYTCGADIGVIPYKAVGLNNYYTSPNKLFEYIQANVVVAGSNFPELKRVIEWYDIGAFFDPESPESIAECLNMLLSDQEGLARMRANVAEAADRYNWDNEARTLISVYGKLGIA